MAVLSANGAVAGALCVAAVALSCSERVAINAAPPRAILEAPAKAFVGDQVVLDASASIAGGDGTIVTYTFAFGDQSDDVRSASPTVIHAYEVPATFRPSVTVLNSYGKQANAATDIVLSASRGPSAGLIPPPSSLTGDVVTLDASSSIPGDSTIQSYLFEFGDGQSAAVQNGASIDHAYESAGVYVARVTVTDGRGVTASATADVVIGYALSTALNISDSPSVASDEIMIALDMDKEVNSIWREDSDHFSFRRTEQGGFTPVYSASPAIENVQVTDHSFSIGPDGSAQLAWSWYDGEVYSVHSEDRGTTWNAPVRVSPNDGLPSFFPTVTVASASHVVLAWTDDRVDASQPATVWVASSIDGGDTFSSLLKVTDEGFCPVAVATNGVVLVAFHSGSDYEPAASAGDIHLVRSVDGAASFGATVDVSQDSQSLSKSCPSLWANETGTVIAAWFVYDPPDVSGGGGAGYTRSHVMIARSFDGGASWDAPREIAHENDIVCLQGSINTAGDLYITYSRLFTDGPYYNWLVASNDAGGSFIGPLPIRQIPAPTPEGIGSGCAQIIARPDGTVNLAFSSPDGSTVSTEAFLTVGWVSTH